MERLDQLLKRVASFKDIYLYNQSIVDPYLLAAHGLAITNRRVPVHQSHLHDQRSHEKIAACIGCNLTIEFDNLEAPNERRDPLQLEIIEHEDDCPYRKVKTARETLNPCINQISQQLYTSLSSSQKYIQLLPSEVLEVLNLKSYSEGSKLNIVVEMLRKLDSNLKKKELGKVKSIHLLAAFGWQVSSQADNELICRFCGTTANVFRFISPSDCTLMNVPSGFSFKSSHRPWCMILQESDPLWRQLLKQAVLLRLANIMGVANKSSTQVKCKDIQDKTIEIYMKHQPRLQGLRKQLNEFKSKMSERYGQDQRGQSFKRQADRLQNILEETKQHVEYLIKRVKLD